MSEPALIQQQRQLLRELKEAAAARAKTEANLAAAHSEGGQAAEEEWANAQASLVSARDSELAAAEAVRQAAEEARTARYAQEQAAVQDGFATNQRAVEDVYGKQKA